MLSNFCIALIRALAVVLTASAWCLTQSQPQLRINSPADGLIVTPGGTVNVSVTSPGGTVFSGVAVLGERPIGSSAVATALPAQFSIAIPTDIACRRYMLTAQGVTAAGDFFESATIHLDVERTDMPVSLASQFQNLTLEAQGQTAPVLLLATFLDGSVLEVTESSKVTYSSTNTAVATVDANGIVTAHSSGTGSILVTYNNAGGANVQLSIPVTVLPPALTAAPASIVFGAGSGVNIGTTVSAQLMLTNVTASDSSLSIKKITTGGDYSETDNCTASPLALDGTCTVSVTFAPTLPGERPGALSVVNSGSGVATVIPLDGVGNNNFALTVSPNSQTISAGGGGSGLYTVAGSFFTGFSGDVNLSASGLPGGAIAAFNPPSINIAGGTSTLTVTASGTTPAGNFPFIVTGTNGRVVQSISTSVTVQTIFSLNSASSSTAGLMQLVPAFRLQNVAISSADIDNQPAGDYLIQAFDTQAGIPSSSGTWQAGTSAAVGIWMRQTAGATGTLFAKVKLFLNGPSGIPVCSAVAASPLLTNVPPQQPQNYISLTCTPSADITMTTADRYYLWVGVYSATTPTTPTTAEFTVGTAARGFGTDEVVVPPLIH